MRRTLRIMVCAKRRSSWSPSWPWSARSGPVRARQPRSRSGRADEVRDILCEAGAVVLCGESHETTGIGFAGTKVSGGGFREYALEPWARRLSRPSSRRRSTKQCSSRRRCRGCTAAARCPAALRADRRDGRRGAAEIAGVPGLQLDSKTRSTGSRWRPSFTATRTGAPSKGSPGRRSGVQRLAAVVAAAWHRRAALPRPRAVGRRRRRNRGSERAGTGRRARSTRMVPAAVGVDGDPHRAALLALRDARVPFLVGGAYALQAHLGVLPRAQGPRPLPAARATSARRSTALRRAGYATELTFPHWLGKATRRSEFVDIIFSSGNGVADGRRRGSTHATMPTCSAWRCCCARRRRGSGRRRSSWSASASTAPTSHTSCGCAETLDWARLLRRFDQHWRVLLRASRPLRFIYPAERDAVPRLVMDGWRSVSPRENVADAAG